MIARMLYLTLWTNKAGGGVQVAVPEAEARTLDRKGFVSLYRRHVLRPSRRDARRWADQQIRDRDAARARDRGRA